MDNRLSFLVLTCDRDNDLVTPFLICFHSFFGSNDYPVIFAGENQIPGGFAPAQNTIYSLAKSTSFFDKIMTALAFVHTDYVVFMCVDFFLRGKSHERALTSTLDDMDKLQAIYCNTYPIVRGWKAVAGSSLVNLDKIDNGGINVCSSLWRVSFLRSTLKPDMTWPWNFESYFCSNQNQHIPSGINSSTCLSTRKPLFQSRDGLVRGRWDYPAVRYLKHVKVSVDFSTRAELSHRYSRHYRFMRFLQSHRFTRWLHDFVSKRRAKANS
jgi:hypothetical protein